MAKNTSVSIDNDVQIIREILFGEQMKSMQKRIDMLEKEVASLKRESSKLQKELKSEQVSHQQEYQTLNAGLSKSQAEQERKCVQIEERLSERIENDHQTLSRALGEAQSGLVKKIDQLGSDQAGWLAEHNRLHENLINSLASALLKFQNDDSS